MNHTHIALSLLNAKVNTKQIAICVYSGDTGSTKSGMLKSIKSFMKTEANKSA